MDIAYVVLALSAGALVGRVVSEGDMLVDWLEDCLDRWRDHD